MTGLLRGCRAKIERASESFKNLNEEIVAFLSANPPPYDVSKHLQNDSREYVFVAKSIRPVPDRFAVLAGEIVHHLNSSLDHLFAALVTRNGHTVGKAHYFPIYTETRKYRKACAEGLIQDVSPVAQKVIDSVQPCFTPAPRDTILATVRELDNTDKHNLLVVLTGVGTVGDRIVIGVEGENVRDIYGNFPNIVALGDPKTVEITESGVEFFSITLAQPVPEFKADANVRAMVVFAQCGLAKLVPVPTILGAMITGVVHTINLFMSEFDTDD